MRWKFRHVLIILVLVGITFFALNYFGVIPMEINTIPSNNIPGQTTVDLQIIPGWRLWLNSLFGTQLVINPNPVSPGSTVTWTGGTTWVCGTPSCSAGQTGVGVYCVWTPPSGSPYTVTKDYSTITCGNSLWLTCSLTLPQNAVGGTWTLVEGIYCPNSNSGCSLQHNAETFTVTSSQTTTTTTPPSSCTPGYTGIYQCVGNSLQEQYKNSDCSLTWNTIQNCQYGCSNGQCLSQTTTTTTTNPCQGVTCNNYCNGNMLYNNGVCSNGQCSYASQNCPYGCSNNQCNLAPTTTTITNPPTTTTTNSPTTTTQSQSPTANQTTTTQNPVSAFINWISGSTGTSTGTSTSTSTGTNAGTAGENPSSGGSTSVQIPSYTTTNGIVWYVLIFFIIIVLVYGLYIRNKKK